jgi:hypothetical protein
MSGNTYTFSVKSKEKKLNDTLSLKLAPVGNKLIDRSTDLKEKFKNLNEELKEIIQMEKELKVREMLAANKKNELVNLERRMKEKNNMKMDMQNVLDCYLIILKNNEELLNRRIEDLKVKDVEMRKKEFLLNKVILGSKKGKNKNILPNGKENENNNQIKNEINNNGNRVLTVMLNEEFCINKNYSKTDIRKEKEKEMANGNKKPNVSSIATGTSTSTLTGTLTSSSTSNNKRDAVPFMPENQFSLQIGEIKPNSRPKEGETSKGEAKGESKWESKEKENRVNLPENISASVPKGNTTAPSTSKNIPTSTALPKEKEGVNTGKDSNSLRESEPESQSILQTKIINANLEVTTPKVKKGISLYFNSFDHKRRKSDLDKKNKENSEDISKSDVKNRNKVLDISTAVNINLLGHNNKEDNAITITNVNSPIKVHYESYQPMDPLYDPTNPNKNFEFDTLTKFPIVIELPPPKLPLDTSMKYQEISKTLISKALYKDTVFTFLEDVINNDICRFLKKTYDNKNLEEMAEKEFEEEKRINAEEEKRLKAEEDKRIKAEEDRRIKAEEDNRIKAEEDKRIKAEEDRRLKAEEEKRLKAEEDRRLKAEEEKRLKAEEDRRLKAEEDRRLKAEEDKRIKAEEDKRIKAEEDRRLKAEEDKRIKAEEDRRIKAEEEKRIKAEEDKRIKAEEDRRLKAEEDKRIKAEEDRRIKAEEEKRIRAEEEKQKEKEKMLLLEKENNKKNSLDTDRDNNKEPEEYKFTKIDILNKPLKERVSNSNLNPNIFINTPGLSAVNSNSNNNSLSNLNSNNINLNNTNSLANVLSNSTDFIQQMRNKSGSLINPFSIISSQNNPRHTINSSLMGRRSDPNLIASAVEAPNRKQSGQRLQKSNSMILNPSQAEMNNNMNIDVDNVYNKNQISRDSKEKDIDRGVLPHQGSNQSLNLGNDYGSRVSTGSKSKNPNENSMSQSYFPDDIIDSEEDGKFEIFLIFFVFLYFFQFFLNFLIFLHFFTFFNFFAFFYIFLHFFTFFYIFFVYFGNIFIKFSKFFIFL